MKQMNLMAEWTRLERLSELGDALEIINKVINWEMFRPTLEKAFYREAKGHGGRPPFDRVMMLKIVKLQQWYNIADDNTEYVINDRLSFQRFLGLSLSDKVPDAKTIWAYKERLKESGVYDELFNLFNQLLEDAGIITRNGSLVDASFMNVPRQRNTREENKVIKESGVPEGWTEEEKKHMLAQKDLDARWMKKNGVSYYGYKNHTKVDRDSKMIVTYAVTPASDHDSTCFEALLDESDKAVWADSGYVGEDLHTSILGRFPGLKLNIHEKGYRSHPLTNEQKASNREKSIIRARVEHVYGDMTNGMNGMFMRGVGIMRATRDIALKNLAYNIRRLASLYRLNRVFIPVPVLP
jgi:IS5 family transposase